MHGALTDDVRWLGAVGHLAGGMSLADGPGQLGGAVQAWRAAVGQATLQGAERDGEPKFARLFVKQQVCGIRSPR